jgi:S1-C subfamily serine protease
MSGRRNALASLPTVVRQGLTFSISVTGRKSDPKPSQCGTKSITLQTSMRIPALWLIVTLGGAGFAQTPTPSPTAAPTPPPPQQQPAWTEHYRNATISLGRIVTDRGQDVFQVVGTGVIAAVDSKTAFIVTAKHVFDDPSQSWHPSKLRVRFAWQEKKSLSEEHGISIDLTDENGRNLWTAPADGDLAALPLPASFKDLPLHAIGVQDFSTADDLYDGASVFVYGFPAAVNSLVGNEALVRAITRGGVVAWTDPNGPLDNPFLIDANVLPGNSGGPVFRVPSGMARTGGFAIGGRVAFLGIVTQDITGCTLFRLMVESSKSDSQI